MTTVEALLKPITAAELKEYNQSAHQLPQSNANQQFSIDLEQRNFYGKQQLNNFNILSRNYIDLPRNFPNAFAFSLMLFISLTDIAAVFERFVLVRQHIQFVYVVFFFFFYFSNEK